MLLSKTIHPYGELADRQQSLLCLGEANVSENTGNKVDYGNWLPKRLIYFLAVLSIVFLGLSYLSLFFLIGAALFMIPLAYFLYAYFQFSPSGGNLLGKFRDFVFARLVWNGDGKLLDIGCGNGLLAIEAAEKYPRAQVVGIDYWGTQWDYSQKACEKNAEIAGVSERTSFRKASASKLPFEDEHFDALVSNLCFHEVADTKDKREVVKEALRTLKKGGVFAFQDLFLSKQYYGEPESLLALIRSWGIQDVAFANTRDQEFVPRALRLSFMMGQAAVLHGTK